MKKVTFKKPSRTCQNLATFSQIMGEQLMEQIISLWDVIDNYSTQLLTPIF